MEKRAPGRGRNEGELFRVFHGVETGLHAMHLTIGMGRVRYMLLWQVRQGEISPTYYVPLEVAGIYWSFVNAV